MSSIRRFQRRLRRPPKCKKPTRSKELADGFFFGGGDRRFDRLFLVRRTEKIRKHWRGSQDLFIAAVGPQLPRGAKPVSKRPQHKFQKCRRLPQSHAEHDHSAFGSDEGFKPQKTSSRRQNGSRPLLPACRKCSHQPTPKQVRRLSSLSSAWTLPRSNWRWALSSRQRSQTCGWPRSMSLQQRHRTRRSAPSRPHWLGLAKKQRN